jgi:competence protein ComEA
LVHVNGAVNNPGVYALPVGGRVQDALAAAGGLLPEADAGAINLAAFLEDGQQIWVPTGLDEPDLGQKGGTVPEMPDEDPPESTSDPRYPININTATQSELESLPGIGSVIAQRIIEYRLEFGPFKKIEEIKAVNGIGDAKFDQVKDYITISQTP